MPQNRPNILIVDDDRIDVLSVKDALEENKVAHRIFVANDGLAALNFMRNSEEKAERSTPWLILLDLNMPRMNGLEFLRAIRLDPELKSTIIFILTTSRDDRDRSAAYEQNVAGYVVKSDVGKDFSNLMNLLKDYNSAVQFPPSSEFN